MTTKYNAKNSNCIASVTPTICRLMDVKPPSVCNAGAVESFVETILAKGVTKVDKCLVYAPDAIGTYFYRKYAEFFSEVIKHAPVEIPLLSVLPPKTPVCFASMFTGSMPEVHGVRAYEKPVIKCQTIFDAMVNSDRKTAITAVTNSSIDLIFRRRNIDYFSEVYDKQVTERAMKLIESNDYDFIVAYHQEYDDTLHRTTPESPEAIEAVKRHAESFVKLAKCCESAWSQYNYMIMFTPDHGGHINPATGKGTHGEDMPEDMEVTHFYGLYHPKCKV